MFAPLPTASLRLSDLFSSPYHFRIPDFQRAYSWTIKEAARLLEDLSGAAGIDDPDLHEPDYFLGAILILSDEAPVLPQSSAAAAPRLFDIIDGQQRLVTLTILLAVLRDLMPDSAASVRAMLDGFIHSRGKGNSGPAGNRLELRDAEQPFFAEHIQRAGGSAEEFDEEELSDSERGLLAVRDHFHAELAALEAADLVRLAEYIAGRSHFAVILAQGIDRAHRLFEVLNDRGKPLARNDILKAELLRQCPEPQRAEVLGGWNEAARRLGADFEHLFGHIRVITGHHRPQIIAGIRNVVREMGGPEPFVRSTLVPLSQVLQAILNPDAAEIALDRATRDLLHQLGRLNGSEWVPPAMLAIDINRDDPGRALSAIRAVDRFVHLSRILSFVVHKRVRRVHAAIGPISERADLDRNRSNGPLHITGEEMRVIGFNLRDVYGRNSGLAKLILLRLNDAIAGVATRHDPARLTVEHVLPLRPATQSAWRKLFPDAEERESCANSLGNLILIGERQNPRARNLEFAEKKRIFAETDDSEPPLALSADVIAAERWGPAEIRARERKLMHLVGKIWDLDYDVLMGSR